MRLHCILLSAFFFFANTANAHTDTFLGEGAHHNFYHLLFWALCAAVAFTIFRWVRAKRMNK